LKAETVPRDPAFPRCKKRRVPVPEPANDNGLAGGIRAEVLISKDSPITQMEIEVFALLLDDLVNLAANDNEGQPE
jgi:hypothetical protein